MKPLDELDYVNKVLEGLRFTGMDQNPHGIRDLLGTAIHELRQEQPRAGRVMVGPTKELSFGEALRRLKNGERVCRVGWNGKGMWLTLIDSGPDRYIDAGNRSIDAEFAPWIGMKTADGKFVPWLASQTDVLAEDWETVP